MFGTLESQHQKNFFIHFNHSETISRIAAKLVELAFRFVLKGEKHGFYSISTFYFYDRMLFLAKATSTMTAFKKLLFICLLPISAFCQGK